MTDKLPPRNQLECYSNFHCERCNYEVEQGEKYVRVNEHTETGMDFEFICMRCAKEDEPIRPCGI